MKRQNIVIQINSYSDLDKEWLIELIENKLGIGFFVNSIKSISVLDKKLEYSKIDQKKNKWFKELCINNKILNVEFTVTTI